MYVFLSPPAESEDAEQEGTQDANGMAPRTLVRGTTQAGPALPSWSSRATEGGGGIRPPQQGQRQHKGQEEAEQVRSPGRASWRGDHKAQGRVRYQEVREEGTAWQREEPTKAWRKEPRNTEPGRRKAPGADGGGTRGKDLPASASKLRGAGSPHRSLGQVRAKETAGTPRGADPGGEVRAEPPGCGEAGIVTVT